MSRDPEITHKIMSAIPQKNTEPEMILRKCLWHSGMRYRVNMRELPGKPDIVLTRPKIAVFVDGDYWHGHNWAIRGLASLEDELSGYSEFWRGKILRNIERDKQVTSTLTAAGWHVIRFWESDIRTNPEKCLAIIRQAYDDFCPRRQ